MHTISTLRRTLGLSTDNQVRNRIERIKDLLSEHIRRGPNNQIFLTDAGLGLLRQLQELYDTGLTLAEASNVLRAKSLIKPQSIEHQSPAFASNRVNPPNARPDTQMLADELNRIHEKLAALERRLVQSPSDRGDLTDEGRWWKRLREDVDVT